MSFAQSPYDMIAYDDKAEYDVPSDGVCLPELPTVDELAGMITLINRHFPQPRHFIDAILNGANQ